MSANLNNKNFSNSDFCLILNGQFLPQVWKATTNFEPQTARFLYRNGVHGTKLVGGKNMFLVNQQP